MENICFSYYELTKNMKTMENASMYELTKNKKTTENTCLNV